MKEKFITKYMKLAKTIADDNDACYSRKIGVVITNDKGTKVLGVGYNGPAPGVPHCDTEDYLKNFFWPQLTDEEKEMLLKRMLEEGHIDDRTTYDFRSRFSQCYNNCKVCPRRLVNAGPGMRSELCQCGHAERHAITNAACDLENAVMFCWCGVPCIQCTDAIIHSGIKTVYCHQQTAEQMYHAVSMWQFEKANCEVIQVDISTI